MNAKFALLLLVAVVNAGLGLFVYYRNRRRLVNKLFMVLVLSTAAWALAVFLIRGVVVELDVMRLLGQTVRVDKSLVAVILGRFIFADASLIALSFFYFCMVFPNQRSIAATKPFWIFTLGALCFVGMAPSKLIFESAEPVGATFKYRYGAAFPAFILYFLSCFGYGLGILATKWRYSQGSDRLQIQYLFMGALLAALGGITTNLLLPWLFNRIEYGGYGPFFSIFMVTFTAHAIVRYRLMDIRLVLRKSLVYLTSIILVTGIWLGVVFWANPSKQRPFVSTGIILSLAIAFGYIRKGVERFLSFYLYQTTSSYQNTLQQASQVLTTVLDFQQLLDYLANIISQSVKVDAVSIFLYDVTKHKFECRLRELYLQGQAAFVRCFTDHAALTTTLRQHGQPLIRDELEKRFAVELADRLLVEMADIGAEVVLGISFKGNLIGFIGIGSKLSGNAYFAEDLAILSLIADQTAIAVRNADLYQQVVELRQYNEDVLNHIESGVIAVDSNKMITMVNAAAEKVAQVNATELIGQSVDRLDPALSCLIIQALHTEKSHIHQETSLTVGKNRSIPILYSTTLIRDTFGDISDVILVFNDQTEIKSLELERDNSQKLALVGTLATSLAHEIKNPLVAIRVFAELLPEKFSDPEFRDRFSKIAIAEIDRVDALISQFRDLDYAQFPQILAVDAVGVLEDTLSILTSKLMKQQINVSRSYAPALPKVRADAAQLKQVFLNLLLNSLEAMPAAGNLHLRSFTVASSVSYQTNVQEMVGISISDTGSGIAEDDLPKIFTPFFSTKESGTGLGLAICDRIIDSFAAKIDVRNNTDGPGVTVTVYLQSCDDP